MITQPLAPAIEVVADLDVPSSFLGLDPVHHDLAIVCACWGYCGGSKAAGDAYAQAAGKRISHAACPKCEAGMLEEIARL